MEVRELSVPGAIVLTPRQHSDDRGMFCELFKAEVLQQATGRTLDLAQANCSVSRQGVLRGVHFADVPPSQAKYVTCPSGAILDVVVDIRVGSPTFGAWDAVQLDDLDRRAIFIAEGLGHAFFALSESATVVYLCSTGFTPGREHGINPLDPALGITWPADIAPILSEKDATAASLADAATDGLLPTWENCVAFAAKLQS